MARGSIWNETNESRQQRHLQTATISLDYDNKISENRNCIYKDLHWREDIFCKKIRSQTWPRNSLFIFVLTCNCTHLLRKAKETIDYTNEPLQWATKLTWNFVSFFTERTQSSNSHLTIIWLGPSPLPAMILEWWASDGGKAAILEPLISFGQTTNNNFSPSYYK